MMTWQNLTADSPLIFTSPADNPSGQKFILNPAWTSFYGSDEPGADGLPRNGTFWEDGQYAGSGQCSCFDVTGQYSDSALFFRPLSGEGHWILQRADGELSLCLASGDWQFSLYQGNEPDWNRQKFPFRNLPPGDQHTHHAYVRGLLDFLAGTRRSSAGIIFQTPNTSIGKGYCGDGIPDTFFQFCAAYPHLSDRRREFLRSQISWLGNHLRPDGCVPWGGCNQDLPYYHLWKREDCGMFFDGNGLWLEINRLLWKWDQISPDPEKIIRAADFYLHYMTEEGLVAAEAKMTGCEWADFLQNGWHSSLINVIACRGLQAAAELMAVCGFPELQDRYQRAADRLKRILNCPPEQGGLFTENGLADWRDPQGKLFPFWRIDTHMLALLWDILEPDNAEAVLRKFIPEYFRHEPEVPAPYLLSGSWAKPEDCMLAECRTFGCGTAAMPGRMGASAVAALRKYGKTEEAERIRQKLISLVTGEPALWEYYETDGTGKGQRSYIEHALSPLLAETFFTEKQISQK